MENFTNLTSDLKSVKFDWEERVKNKTRTSLSRSNWFLGKMFD